MRQTTATACQDTESTREVTTNIDPDRFYQPTFDQVPDTRLTLMAFEPRPLKHEPIFDHTTAQRTRHQQLMDEAWRMEHRDYYNAELGILEPEGDEVILSVDDW